MNDNTQATQYIALQIMIAAHDADRYPDEAAAAAVEAAKCFIAADIGAKANNDYRVLLAFAIMADRKAIKRISTAVDKADADAYAKAYAKATKDNVDAYAYAKALKDITDDADKAADAYDKEKDKEKPKTYKYLDAYRAYRNAYKEITELFANDRR